MKKNKGLLLDVLLIFAGNFTVAFAATFFILPNKILSGGVAGFAIALYPIFNVNPEIMINIILVVTFMLGFIFLGKEFALKTLASTILYPLFVYLFGFIEIQTSMSPILASIYGGILTGIGLGLTFRTGASTGGMDIVPLILEKYTNVKVSIWILLSDSLVILLGLSNYGLELVLIGFLSVFTASYAIDKIQMMGGDKAKQVFIITHKKHEVLHAIHTMIDRGSTLIPAKGGYTNEEREMIMTVLMHYQYPELEKIVKELDPEALMIVSDATEVHGPGFYKV
ncbi:YitT family protein [Erysipelothrix urinaevulpis]|uniref:YitT family protein n=1 Tax=Erysipelothrix urinaevulpis TaxID=2683717 RepID=UPI001359F4D9|nr:YitT family protein [Erysipelothrix urinaevulpis]